ncbi:hypothetical protein M8C21_014926 [Ambrosia artemisiifolia]|uniref:Cytochrome P450 n=1 Tax=Ambrosia artemisiifolia TaxID=4212 RepID=A0AAD5GU89_AMBAR|nr:hypothetical protein M8C21_014926 [Ambrosia artemisiifolia]
MDFMVVMTLLLLLMLILVPILFLFPHNKYNGQLPPGSLGLPVIGQSVALLTAMKADRVEKWIQERVSKHGPIWKASLLGYPTVVLHGPTANKFMYTCEELTNTQPPSLSRLFGPKNIMELSGNDHKRVRTAVVSFLKVEVLKQYVTKVDEEILHHLQTHWHGKHEVQVQPLIKTLTFDVICSLLFGIERGPQREKFLSLFHDMVKGLLSVPINLPFTKYNRAIIARKKLVPMLIHLIHEKREALKEHNQQGDPHKDLITSLLSIRDDDGLPMMSEEEIIDNIITVMFAGYGTTSVLLTLLVRLLANNKSIYSNIVREQQEISRNKASKEALTWEDLTKMQYTWRVATEITRINPPVALSFRRAKQDIEYGGFIIPKGWQVLISMSMTHMDDNIFQNPTMFDPTRFEKHAPLQPPPPPFSYVAFGGGPRMCPGIELTKIETLVMTHHLVKTFTWELLKKDESFKRVPIPEFDQGLLVKVKPIKETKVSCELCFLAMEFMIFLSLLLLLLLILFPSFFVFLHKNYNGKLPPGSLGLPLIGQSLGLLKALKADRVDKWFHEGITKYGPVWKASLFGYPTVVLHGPTANKFIYTYDGNILTNTQPPSVSRIVGSKNINELSGADHKRVRAALVSFLKPEVLKKYVAKVDEETKHHLQLHWHCKHEVQVQPLIKILTFNLICSLLFGIERGPKREKMLPLFQDMLEGLLSIPINFPFTKYNRGIVARRKLVPMLMDLIREKRVLLEEINQQGDPHTDLITSFLSIRDGDGSTMMSEAEIIDNIILVMIAGYDTTSVLLTFLVRLLANTKSIYSTIVQGGPRMCPGIELAKMETLVMMHRLVRRFTWELLNKDESFKRVPMPEFDQGLGPQREKILPLFQDMIEGVLSIPINLPFTKYNRAIKARKKLVPMIVQLIHKKKEALMEQNQQHVPHKDLITSLLSIHQDDGSTMVSEEEIIDNIIVVMIAGYGTTSILLTFFIRLLASNKSIYSSIIQEQQEISNTKKEALTWEDLTKMKYTWRVATEITRINTPVTLSFRRAKHDIEYGGFIIPKGWQVLTSASMTHMDDSIFPNPTVFDPTRFDTHATSPPPPFSYMTFGAGPRMCPGIELAKMETLVMMHRLVTTFTWELLNKDESFKRIPLAEFDQGLLVQVKSLKETTFSGKV